MARKPLIVTLGDLEDRYPGIDLGDFKPTHFVQTRGHSGSDFVRLDEPEKSGIAFAFLPAKEDPTYAVIPGGKWQNLDVAGIVEADIVRYDANWIPLHERDGHVYFVESGTDGPIKIGWSQDVERRIAELQVANAHKLRLLGVVPGTMQKESDLHATFAHLRMEAEWFQNSPEIHEYLDKFSR